MNVFDTGLARYGLTITLMVLGWALLFIGVGALLLVWAAALGRDK